MSKYLCKITEEYRVDTKEEAKAMIEEAEKNITFTLVKSASEHKEKRKKGEIEDEYEKVTLVKLFNDIKDPIGTEVEVKYEVNSSWGV